MNEPLDDRSPFAAAMEWSARITSISIETLLLILLGYWLDGRFGTKPLFVILGTILGFAVGLWNLVNIARLAEKNARTTQTKKGPVAGDDESKRQETK